MNDKKLYVTAKWYGTECYVTFGQSESRISVALVLSSVEQITQIVDELVAAANAKPEETTDAK
jgi:hypothetical protein